MPEFPENDSVKMQRKQAKKSKKRSQNKRSFFPAAQDNRAVNNGEDAAHFSVSFLAFWTYSRKRSSFRAGLNHSQP